MNKTRIEWCDFTWNPVWGCRNDCPYCYARKLAHRFGESFEPHWKEKNFQRQMPKEPSRVFVNSMSEIYYWEPEWRMCVLERIKRYPQHKFLFLTKHPKTYWFHNFPDNCWLGITATTAPEVVQLQADLSGPHISFLSIEPIHGFISRFAIDIDMVDWLIVGAETGNRKGKVIPERKWIEELVATGLPIFMKDSLIPIWGEDLIRQWPR